MGTDYNTGSGIESISIYVYTITLNYPAERYIVVLAGNRLVAVAFANRGSICFGKK
jgi:predicted proteasome-type protease